MNIIILRQIRGGFSSKDENDKIFYSSFDLQLIIEKIKTSGNTPVLDVSAQDYIKKYQLPYTL